MPEPLGYVSGYVTQDGNGLPGVLVSGELLGNAITDEQGYFQFPTDDDLSDTLFTVSRTGYSFSLDEFKKSEAVIQSLQIAAKGDGIDRSGCSIKDVVHQKASIHTLTLEILALGQDVIEANPTGKNTKKMDTLRNRAKTIISANLALPEIFYSCKNVPSCLSVDVKKAKKLVLKHALKLSKQVKKLVLSTFSEKLGRKTVKLTDRTFRSIKRESKKYPAQTSLCR